nr:MAG TPA: hypothetical protein [Caudoviricetes sp.]
MLCKGVPFRVAVARPLQVVRRKTTAPGRCFACSSVCVAAV